MARFSLPPGVCILTVAFLAGAALSPGHSDEIPDDRTGNVEVVGEAELFAPGIASTRHAEVRLTISPDGKTALWFSRDRPGGAGGYDIWMSRLSAEGWGAATPVSFNSPVRDFDPAFSYDGLFVYFCSDRPGGLGGDDIYRVAVTKTGFGDPENLGISVNSIGAEFAPMLSGDGERLLFSSDRTGGAGGHDLYSARRADDRFAPALPLAGTVNSASNEFDATFLYDDATLVFARVQDFSEGQVNLFVSRATGGRYESGTRLPDIVNDQAGSTYGAMLDWSAPGRLLFSARRDEAHGMDLYSVHYRLNDSSSN